MLKSQSYSPRRELWNQPAIVFCAIGLTSTHFNAGIHENNPSSNAERLALLTSFVYCTKPQSGALSHKRTILRFIIAVMLLSHIWNSVSVHLMLGIGNFLY
jgi:hypothetical protein